jgi:uncharacterized repeat protein (TIGR03803 family)
MSSAGVVSTLYNFDLTRGGFPTGGLVQASNGVFYGAADQGGNFACRNFDGCGTLFKITPAGVFTTLEVFGSNGVPVAPLIQASDGNLYGATYEGLIFRLTLAGKLSKLYQFGSAVLPGSLVQGTDGNLYGGTFISGGGNFGTLFQLTLGGVLTDLHDFIYSDGFGPQNTLLQATEGGFYGATAYGGVNGAPCPQGCGTIFSLSTGLGSFISLTSALGKPGQQIGILGQGLAGSTAVTFNGVPGSFKVVNETFITATVPSAARSGFVAVTTPTGTLTSNVAFDLLP